MTPPRSARLAPSHTAAPACPASAVAAASTSSAAGGSVAGARNTASLRAADYMLTAKVIYSDNNAGGAGLEAVAAFLEQIRGAERIDHSADAALDSQLELADDAVETNDSKKLRTALQTLPFLVTTAFGEDLGHAMAEQAGNLLASLPI